MIKWLFEIAYTKIVQLYCNIYICIDKVNTFLAYFFQRHLLP